MDFCVVEIITPGSCQHHCKEILGSKFLYTQTFLIILGAELFRFFLKINRIPFLDACGPTFSHIKALKN